MDKVFKALADPVRRELLDRLRFANGQTLSALSVNLLMTRQAVMKHLDVLAEAELIQTVRYGREKYHFLNPKPIQHVTDRWIGMYSEEALVQLTDIKMSLPEPN